MSPTPLGAEKRLSSWTVVTATAGTSVASDWARASKAAPNSTAMTIARIKRTLSFVLRSHTAYQASSAIGRD